MKVGMIDLYSNLSKFALHPNKIGGLLRRSLSATTPKPQAMRAFRLDRRLSADKISSLIERYVAGETISAIASECGVSKSGMNDLLTRNGVALRYRRMTPEEVARAAVRYHEGASLSHLAQEFVASQETIRKMLIQAGVKMRPATRV